MKLPLIKSLVEFVDQNDEDYIIEAIEVLEHLGQGKGLNSDELELLGEVLSNMYGSLEVLKSIRAGQSQKDALNGFMKRVMGSIK